MLQQVVKGKPISPLAGFFMSIGIVVMIYIAGGISELIRVRTGFQNSWIAVWLLAAALCILLMRFKLMQFRYTLHDGMLYIERLYGRRGRMLCRIALSDMRGIGPEEAMRAAHPSLKTDIAALKSVSAPRFALRHRASGGERLLIFQPSEELCTAIDERRNGAATAAD